LFGVVSHQPQRARTLADVQRQSLRRPGTTPIQFTSFSKRGEADSFAPELSTALKLPAEDIVGIEPDADENY
jgi:hypothetical protein